MDLYIVSLLVVELVSIAAFTYLAVLFVRVYNVFKVEDILVYIMFILFLLLSQLCGMLSIIISDSRVAAALYVATSSLAIAGFILLLTSSHTGNTYIIMPILVSSPDILAGILSTLIISKHVTGKTRYFMALLSLSYYIRGVSTLLTAAQGPPLLLLVSETIRAIAAVALSLHHTAQVLIYGKKEK